MSTLRVCEGCARHIREAEDSCPFCSAPRSALGAMGKAVAVALTVTVGMTLSACYGGPPRRDANDRGAKDAWGQDDSGAQQQTAPTPSK
jgi:hypothetical protein